MVGVIIGNKYLVITSLQPSTYSDEYKGAAIATHFGLNLLHFGLFTYPMLAG